MAVRRAADAWLVSSGDLKRTEIDAVCEIHSDFLGHSSLHLGFAAEQTPNILGSIMDELRKIEAKSAALIRAREYLLRQSPSDFVAVANITEKIVELTKRHVAAAALANQTLPLLTLTDQQELDDAVKALDDSVNYQAPADQIVSRAAILFDLKPWPP